MHRHDRRRGTARLEEAVAAYRAAREERTPARVPLDWARTQMNLGTEGPKRKVMPDGRGAPSRALLVELPVSGRARTRVIVRKLPLFGEPRTRRRFSKQYYAARQKSLLDASGAANYSDSFVRAFIARTRPEISRRRSIASAA
jgi:hypothetical protein